MGAELALGIEGAEAALKRVEAALATTSETAPAAEDDPQADLRAALTAFESERVRLAPNAAAGAWVDLVKQWLDAPVENGEGESLARLGQRDAAPITLGRLVEIIPGPEAWPTIAAGLMAAADERELVSEQTGLRMVAHLLIKDADGLSEDLRAVAEQQRQNKGSGRWSYGPQRGFEEVARLLGAAERNGDEEVEALEEELRTAQNGMAPYVQVPDLVTLIGPDKALPLLKRVVVSPIQEITFDVGDETKKLARQAALEEIDRLPRPRWGLVNNIGGDSVKLYEAMSARFAKPALTEGDADAIDTSISPIDLNALLRGFSSGRDTGLYDYRQREARGYYVLGLIAQGRAEDATRELRKEGEPGGPLSLPYDAVDQLDRAGYTGRVYEFLHALLRENPDLPLWEMYQSVAVRSGHAAEMLALAREAASRPGLSDEQSRAVREVLADALLAADEVEEGVEALRALIQTPAEDGDEAMTDVNQAIKLATIGVLLKNEAWTQEGLALAMDGFAGADGENDWGRRSAAQNLAALLVKVGRADDAERLLVDELAARVQVERAERAERLMQGYGGYGYDDNDSAELLARLVGLYSDLGRHADVITLLDTAPYWGVRDVAGLIEDDPDATATRSLGAVIAEALVKTGNRGRAVAVANAWLTENSGDDGAYAVLVEALGDAAIPSLDAWFARDPFEERPLIWKAYLLNKAGKHDEALTTIREAIAIDPSDGEQGKGDRMRAYAVLADVLEAKGVIEQVSLYRSAVSAIRLAEDADDFYEIGLLSRGVKMYESALTQFADAYCIQSRLAVQLSNLGRHEEAAEHFRKAYELMPDSFGRMESHCFGCEGVFSTGGGAKIAEQVFQELLEKTPQKPQVHYLYGYLLTSTDRHREALPHFEKAVELDPDYLNAWSKLSSLSHHMQLPIEMRDRATLNLLRLDPLGRHGSGSGSEVWDVAELWQVVAANSTRRPAKVESVYALQGSAAQLDNEEATHKEYQQRLGARGSQAEDHDPFFGWRERSSAPATPGEALAGHVVVVAAGSLLPAQD